jgi:MFS family permease
LIIVSGIVNYMDRATLAIANKPIREELSLSYADMGMLLSAFLWTYAFAQLPAGVLVDRIGPRRVLSIAIVLWSSAQILCDTVRNFSELFAGRALLGLGEAPQFPTDARITRDWFGLRDRGTATGLWNSSSTLGTAISAPLLTVLMVDFGWRGMFIVMGVVGLLVAIAFFSLYRNPSEISLTGMEIIYLTDGDNTVPERIKLEEWRGLFAHRTTWGMIVGFFGAVYVTWIYITWLPAYLETARHLTTELAGWMTAIPFLCGVLGSFAGGRITDRLVKRGLNPIASRKYPMTASLLLTSLATIVVALTPNTIVAMIAISTSVFLLYVSSATAWALASVAAPSNSCASLGAIQNFGGYIGGALAPTATGLILQATNSFTPALLTGAIVASVSAVGYFTLVSDPIPPSTRLFNPSMPGPS